MISREDEEDLGEQVLGKGLSGCSMVDLSNVITTEKDAAFEHHASSESAEYSSFFHTTGNDSHGSTTSGNSESTNSMTETTDDHLNEYISKCLKMLYINIDKDEDTQETVIKDPPAQMLFCENKIALLKRQKTMKKHEGSDTGLTKSKEHQDREQDQLWLESDARICEKLRWKMEELKIRNFTKHLEKVTNGACQHSVTRCRKLREMQAKVKTSDFLRRKLQILQEAEVANRYHEHTTEKTSAMLIANIIKESTHPLAPKKEVWEKLLKQYTDK